MILSFLSRMFGCRHAHQTWPRLRKRLVKGQSRLYQCCTDCGAELDYRIGEHIFALPHKAKRNKRVKELVYLEKLIRKE